MAAHAGPTSAFITIVYGYYLLVLQSIGSPPRCFSAIAGQ